MVGPGFNPPSGATALELFIMLPPFSQSLLTKRLCDREGYRIGYYREDKEYLRNKYKLNYSLFCTLLYPQHLKLGTE